MLRQAWAVQRRVWVAVMMREIQTRWGRRNLGFAWLFAEPLVFAFPVLAMWSAIRAPVEHGIPLMPLLWSGYLPLLIFRHVTGHALYVLRDNAALLYHQAVTPLDIFMGRCGLEALGNLTSVFTSFLALYFIGALQWPDNWSMFLLGYFYMTWWALSIALIVAAASELSDIVEHIWQPLSYMYLPVSGFFFLAEWLPTPLRKVALYVMPSINGYEMIRGAMLGNRITTYYHPYYFAYVLAVLTLIGLWMIRDVRRHLEVFE